MPFSPGNCGQRVNLGVCCSLFPFVSFCFTLALYAYQYQDSSEANVALELYHYSLDSEIKTEILLITQFRNFMNPKAWTLTQWCRECSDQLHGQPKPQFDYYKLCDLSILQTIAFPLKHKTVDTFLIYSECLTWHSLVSCPALRNSTPNWFSIGRVLSHPFRLLALALQRNSQCQCQFIDCGSLHHE